MTGHKDDDGWAEVECPLQEGFAIRPEGGDLLATGTCPRCQGETSWRFRLGQMGSVSSAAELSLREQAKVATIICACGYPHDKRPDDAGESGCGAFWQIPLSGSPPRRQ